MQKISKKHSMVICIAYIVLLLFLSFVGVYAWFTARANRSDDVNFATLEINIRSGSNTISDTDFTTTYLNNISPGSTVNFNTLSIANVGNAPVYTIIKLKLKFQMDGNDHSLIYYYNLNGELVDYKALENNSTPASLIEANQTKSVDLSFTFDGDEFTNDFKQNSVEVTFTALAIQSLIPADETGTYPTSELYAVYYLVEEVDTDTDIASNKVYFYDETGDDLIYIEYVNQNADSIYSGVPTKESTEMYSYVFTGWVDENNRPANLTNITSDVAVYASFSQTLREYELEIVNSTTANLTVTRQGNNLQNGAILHYGDILTISYTENQGSTGHLLVTGADLQSGDNYQVTGNVSIYYSEENIPYSLSIVNNTGAKITILRNDVIYNGGVVYYGDILEITFDSNAGYTGSISVSGASAQSGGYRVTGNVTITYTETRTPYSIQMINNTGAQLKVTRGDETITSSSTLYYDDILNISFVATAGKLGQLEVTGAVRSGGEFTYLVRDDVVITYSEILEDYFLLSVPNGVTVNRDGSDLSTGTIIHYGDVLTISYDLPDNYELVDFSVSGADHTSGNNYSVTGNVNVVFEINLVATPLPFEINENGEITAYTGTATEVTIPSTYSLLEDGTAVEGADHTITGIADATDWNTGAFYNKNITSVTFPDTITKIGSCTFYSSKLTTISIPDSVTNIGSDAFGSCENLTSITIGKGVVSIGEYAFYYCTNLNEINFNATNMPDLAAENYIFGYTGHGDLPITINIGANVTRIPAYLFGGAGTAQYSPVISTVNFDSNHQCTQIGNNAFAYCGISSISIPEGIKTIGNNVFYYCTNLKSITIPSSLESLGWCVFEGCSSLSEVNFAPNSSLTYIDSYTFKNTNINTITLPEGLERIGQRVFESCANLSTVDLPNSLKSMDNYAFYGCTGLTNISIPEGLTSMGFCAFEGCSKLNSVTFEGTSQLTILSEYTFSNCTSLSEIHLPDSIQSIATQAFNGCTNLKSVTLGSGLTHISDYAFRECANLESVTFANSFGWFTASTSDATSGIDILQTDLQNTATAASYLKETYCSSHWIKREPEALPFEINANDEITAYTGTATEVTIPSTYSLLEDGTAVEGTDHTITGIADATSISTGVFYNKNITSITLPETLEKIGSYAFYRCTNLTSITIPDSVTSIGRYVFYNCRNLTEINFNATNMSDLSSGNRVFYNAGQDGAGITVNIGANVTRIPAYLFYPYSNNSYSPNITEVNFAPNSQCTEIGSSAFYNCTNLTSVTIGEGVTSIGSRAFYNCRNLTEINFNATNMSDLSLNNYAFYDVGQDGTGITVNIGANVTRIPAYLFYNSNIAEVNFAPNSQCTEIGNYAFRDCTNLTSITIPDSVTSIGNSAFYNCDNLTSITIGEGVTSIGNYAFQSCKNLTSVTIGKGVTSIGNYAFSYCDKLTSITIPDSVTSIGGGAFYDCRNLTEINFNATNMSDLSSRNNVFTNAGQEGAGITVNIGANVTRIPAYLFYTGSSSYAQNITEVNFAPNSQCTEIGSWAFRDCTNLTSITIPDSVTSIGEYAFSDCTNLTSITIPDSVTSIGEYAFYACRNLTEINFNATNMADLSSGNYVFAYAGQDGTGITVNIGANVTRIPAYLFYSGSASSSIDYSPNITEVNFAPNSQCTEIGNCAFYDCNNLTSITIPDSVTSIGISAFYGSGITSITIPDSVTSIGDRAFYWCTNLTSITIGEGVASIGDWAFYASYSLVYVVNKSSLAFEVGDYGTNIYDNPMLEIVSDESEQNLIDIKGNRYKDYDGERYFIKNLDGSSEIEIDSTCTQIYQYAFYNNENITSITIPEGVTSIGESVFKGCTNLESIIVEEGNAVYHCEGNCLIETASKTLILGCKNSVIPTDGSVTSIGDNAFHGSGIASITIPDSVTSIGNYAFYNCTNLISITIGEGITSIGSYAFSGCTNLTSITIPDSVTSIGNSAFYNCDNLTSVTIGNGVTSIGSSAFSYCTNLTSVSIGEGVTSIGSSAFSVCSNLTSVTIESNYAYANATSASACGYLLRYATEVRVLTSCIDSSVNSYLENTSNFSWTTDGEYTVYTKVA